MAGPRAAIPAIASSRRDVTADTLDQPVANRGDASLKVIEVLSVPGGAISSGDGISAAESDVQDVCLIVAAVTVNTTTITCSRKGDGGLADNGEVAIVAVSIAPDPVNLNRISVDLVPKSRAHRSG